jgi:hypothetical protein
VHGRPRGELQGHLHALQNITARNLLGRCGSQTFPKFNLFATSHKGPFVKWDDSFRKDQFPRMWLRPRVYVVPEMLRHEAGRIVQLNLWRRVLKMSIVIFQLDGIWVFDPNAILEVL